MDVNEARAHVAENRHLIEAFLKSLAPTPKMWVSEWADKYRWLSATNAEPGPWRTDRAPYLKFIMDKLSSKDPCKRLVVMKGAQLGLTEAGCNWIGYIIHNNPATTMLVMPTESTLKKNIRLRFTPMFQDTPVLRERIMEQRRDAAGNKSNNLEQKDFPGGSLIMATAKSPASLRSIPAKYIMLDEIDEYENDLADQGDVVSLAEARSRTFPTAKLYMISTPTTKGGSKIAQYFEATDQNYFYVPCPSCGHKQHLVWEQMRWEQGKPNTARYECIACKYHISNHQKTKMLAQGEFIAHYPERSNPEEVGVHINSLYSPVGWYSWSQAVADYEKALIDPYKMKTFQNTVLGLCYEEPGDVPDWERIYERRENYDQKCLPAGICLIVAGADVQKDRIEVEVVGYGKDRESWSIDYRVFEGDTSEPSVWNQLAALVSETWEREDRAILPLAHLCVDSGYRSNYVYDFCRKFPKTVVSAVKGDDRMATMLSRPRAVDYTSAGKESRRTALITIGVSHIKSEIYGYLSQRIDPETGEVPFGYCHFPQYNAEYFKGLTAEKLQETKNSKGQWVYTWKKHYTRNEPLDCRVYARAAAEKLEYSRLTNAQIEKMSKNYQRRAMAEPAESKPKVKKKRGSDWL